MTQTTIIALIGAKALWLTYIWLASAIAAAWISERKGYGERPGLAAGLILSAAGLLIMLIWPARAESRWKTRGRAATAPVTPHARGRLCVI